MVNPRQFLLASLHVLHALKQIRTPHIKVEALTTIPRTMKNSFKEISRPRIRLGAVSAMYIGAACIA
jgi:hypothetical protein